MSVKIHNLSKVISQLGRYNSSFQKKIDSFLEQIAILGAYRARIDFSNAMYAGDNDVEVSVEPYKGGFKIAAKGRAVLFIEFGTGIINPEHPQSSEFGFSHGSYGSGKGANENGWVYIGEQGNAGQPIKDGVYRTYGNPPARAMYNASKEIEQELLRIAREVFG